MRKIVEAWYEQRPDGTVIKTIKERLIGDSANKIINEAGLYPWEIEEKERKRKIMIARMMQRREAMLKSLKYSVDKI